MFKKFDVYKFVESKLDQISSSGLRFGKGIGTMSRSTSKIFYAILVLVFFGLIVFLYGIAQGLREKKKM